MKGCFNASLAVIRSRGSLFNKHWIRALASSDNLDQTDGFTFRSAYKEERRGEKYDTHTHTDTHSIMDNGSFNHLDKQTNRQNDRQTDRQTERQTEIDRGIEG